MRVPITRPVLGAAEQEAVAAVLASGYLVQGPNVAQFESLVAERVGTRHAVAVSNCTEALRVSLLALGIGPGHRVAVAPYSWVATANAIELVGATPVFVDLDPLTFNMAADALERVINSVSAVLPVDTFGNPAGITQLEAIARAAGVPLLEDAACALGAVEDGQAAGSFGAASCFSFHPRKIITTGEGGMITTDNDAIASFARAYRNHGQAAVNDEMAFVAPGGNLRLTEMQGAIGVAQMARLEGLIAARALAAARYDALLPGLGLTPQYRSAGAAVQSYVALTPSSISAAPVIAQLRADGIEATIGTNAIPFTRYYSAVYGLTAADLPVTADVAARAITLPLFPGISEEQQDDVLAALGQVLH